MPVASTVIALLGVPLLLGLWARRVALAHIADDVSSQWFAFAQRMHWTMIGAWLAWLTAALSIGRFSFDRLVHATYAITPVQQWFLLFVPPTAITIVLAVITHDVARRLACTDVEPRQHRAQLAAYAASILIPSLAIMLGIAEFGPGTLSHLWTGLGLFVLAIVAAMMASARLRASLGFTPQSVTSGDLRDRIFELARRAGVTLQQLYVIPTKQRRLANAFAVRQRLVVLTDLLLDELDRDEVDAILAHEVTHLKHQHPQKLGFLIMIAPVATIFFMGRIGAWMPLIAFTGSMALLLTFSRRFERTADRGAIALGGDPEALIAGLVKLARLNHVPLAWGRMQGLILTHPSVEQRAHEIGRVARLSPVRIAELLAGRRASGARYALPPLTGDQARLFSSTFKARWGNRIALTVVATCGVVPALLALLARLAPIPFGGGLAFAVIATAAAFACSILVVGRLAVAPLRELETPVRARIARGRSDALDDTNYVGLAPGPDARVYEGFYNWDVGFLARRGGRLVYEGEEARFALARGHVRAIELVPGGPSWIPTSSVRVRWEVTPDLNGCFRLTPADAPTLFALGRRASRLHDELTTWWRGSDTTPATDAHDEVTEAPPVRPVTSVLPRAQVTARPLVMITLLQIIVTLVLWLATVSVLGVERQPSWFAIGFAAIVANLAHFIPALRSKPSREATPAQPAESRRAA